MMPSHLVVVNHEQQYSLWSTKRPLPGGWQAVTIPAVWLENHRARNPQDSDKAICLAYIGEIWQDMRPLSVCRFQTMQQQTSTGAMS
ncbi:MbtH family NRPS accessory protein [Idiomarina loihiensis]|uniref:MbtH family NRPS accessory protein n=2 Tax=Idiomarina TaxID=135575 RepID=UPI001AACD89E|nr:MbtH family NRPS accessory protein [Idiomarina loihiensis]